MKGNFIKQIGKWLMMLSCLLFSVHSVCAESAFEENFELGIGLWFADNGLWEVGVHLGLDQIVAIADHNVLEQC